MKEITIDLETVTLAGSEQGCDLCMTVHGVTDCPHPSRDKPECPPLVLRILEPGEVAVKREDLTNYLHYSRTIYLPVDSCKAELEKSLKEQT